MMTASNHGLRWEGDVSDDHATFSAARNRAAQSLYDDPDSADGIMWVDSDILPPPLSIARLLLAVRAYDCEFITGIYHKKAPPYEPVIYQYMPEGDTYNVICEYFSDPGICSPLGACGFGFCWTSTKCIQQIAAMKGFDKDTGKWFPDTRDMPKNWRDADGRPPYGEDFNFCDKARRAGVQLYVDTGCLVDHMGGGTVFGSDTYKQYVKSVGGIEGVGKVLKRKKEENV
jgi:hypothetical protein